MAIPDQRLSTLLVEGHFLQPDNLENQLLMDYERGGIGLNDPTEGLFVQDWVCRYAPATGDVTVSADNWPSTVVFNRPLITELSFTFDQNMQPFVTFVQDGVAKFYWWDTNISSFTFSDLPANSITPRCCLDDKRYTQADSSDIILCYVHSGALKYRQQRDRYTIEYTLDDPFLHPQYQLPAVLKRVGMNEKGRLQWLCDLADPISWCEYVNYGN